MTLNYELDLHKVKMNHVHTKYLPQRLLSSKVIDPTQTHTQPTNCTTRPQSVCRAIVSLLVYLLRYTGGFKVAVTAGYSGDDRISAIAGSASELLAIIINSTSHLWIAWSHGGGITAAAAATENSAAIAAPPASPLPASRTADRRVRPTRVRHTALHRET